MSQSLPRRLLAGSPAGWCPDPTDLAILAPLRQETPPVDAWGRFHACYRPILLRWCARHGLQPADSEEVAQKVLLRLVRTLRAFDYDPARGRFQSWLARVVRNAVLDHRRGLRRSPGTHGSGSAAVQRMLEAWQAPATTQDFATEMAHFDSELRQAVDTVKAQVEPDTWEAFYRAKVREEKAAQVAPALGKSRAAVYQAIFRVRRLLAAAYLRIQPTRGRS